jgi:hypothetical protein
LGEVSPSPFTIIAFLLAAYWYFVERKGQPRIDVTQDVRAFPLENGIAAVEAQVRIRNIGSRLFKVREVQSYLQDIEERSYSYKDLVGLHGEAYWGALRNGSGDSHFEGPELRWPVVAAYEEGLQTSSSGAAQAQRQGLATKFTSFFSGISGSGSTPLNYVEPGETDLMVLTFLVDCSEVGDHVRVATDVIRPRPRNRRLAWKARSYLDLRETCSQETTR